MASSGMMSIAEMAMILDRDDAARDRGHGVRGPRVPSAGSMKRSSARFQGGLIIKQLERELVRVDFSVTLARRRETLARAKKHLAKTFGQVYLTQVLPKKWRPIHFRTWGGHDTYSSFLDKGIDSFQVLKRHHLPDGSVETAMEVLHERDNYQFTCGVKMHSKSRPQVPMAS